MALVMSIGSVVFADFEVPESLESLGTKQAHKKREFPGGTITIRNLGAFPLPLSWRGYLTGPTAFDRMAELQRLAATGQSVKLAYGRVAWQGEVIEFDARPRHEFLIPYTIHFEPTKDLSGIGTVPAGQPSPESQLSTQQGALVGQQGGGTSALDPSAGGSSTPTTWEQLTPDKQSAITSYAKETGASSAIVGQPDASGNVKVTYIYPDQP